MVKELLEVFMKKKLQKASQEKFRIEKYLKEKGIDCSSNGRGMILALILGSINKISYKYE